MMKRNDSPKMMLRMMKKNEENDSLSKMTRKDDEYDSSSQDSILRIIMRMMKRNEENDCQLRKTPLLISKLMKFSIAVFWDLGEICTLR